jgi:hypothetical protein
MASWRLRLPSRRCSTARFARVYGDHEAGTIAWPGGIAI